MPARGERLLVCPDCGRRGVHLRMTTNEDHWGCRYCEWYAFSFGEDTQDRMERGRLAQANPDREIWVTSLSG